MVLYKQGGRTHQRLAWADSSHYKMLLSCSEKQRKLLFSLNEGYSLFSDLLSSRSKFRNGLDGRANFSFFFSVSLEAWSKLALYLVYSPGWL